MLAGLENRGRPRLEANAVSQQPALSIALAATAAAGGGRFGSGLFTGVSAPA